jgi:hypothetical protein
MINELSTKVVIGVFEASETVDSNLSQVRVASDSLYRYVPKLAGVTLTMGDQVMMIKGRGTPLTIIGVPVGDISLVL